MLPDEPPTDVYVDTDVLVHALIGGMAQSQTCYSAYRYLVAHSCAVYISQLTRLEFLEAIRGLANKRSLPESIRLEFDLEHWENFMVRQRIWRDAPGLMALTAMRAYDTFHLATALSYQIPELWTADADFRRSSGIYIRILRAPT
jgi:predicted nucleic acid-binding protein